MSAVDSDGAVSAITVLVAARTHPVSRRASRCPADAIAVSLALSLSLPLRLLSAGNIDETVARDYLALGAERLEVLPCADAAHSPAYLADCLLPALQSSDWVLAGTRSSAEQGSGILPYALAAALRRPLLAEVCAIERESAQRWIVTQALPQGARRRLRVQAPAVLVVSAAAPVPSRHSLAAAQAGSIVQLAAGDAAVAAPIAPTPPRGRRVAANKHRPLLEAPSAQSAHSRMLSAIASAAAGGSLIDSGGPDAKAQAVLDYLRKHSLVSF